MIFSMTGFGKANGIYQGKKISVEIKSLNSRQADTKLRLPNSYREKEVAIRNEITGRLQRGKIDCLISLEQTDNNSVVINHTLALSYHEQLRELTKNLGEERSDYLELLLRMPDVVSTDQEEPEEEEWKILQGLVQKALDNLEQFRAEEGKILEEDIVKRVALILEILAEIHLLAPERLESKKEKLNSKLRDLQAEIENIDENRFEQELIYYLEKLDITEEEVRLKAHCNYFTKTLAAKEGQGKKLGFIAQEMGREINTIGSKANHAGIQQLVVQMKDELEKIKEQVLNIL